MKRHKMSRGSSRRSFTKGASTTHKFNVGSTCHRGGIRL
ncbi:MAG: hypothetical protein [Microvirus sp.]|nr:MAG: hypothetical protein [Microvirus sp.]